MTRRAALLGVMVAALCAVSAAASATWQATRQSFQTVSAAAFSPATAPVPELVGAPGTTLTLRWSPSTIGGRAPTSYALARYVDGGTAAVGTTPCPATVADGFVSCAVTVPAGSWRFTEAPVYLGWMGSASPQSAIIAVVTQVTTVPPPAITFPVASTTYGPSGWLAGCTTAGSAAICGTAPAPSSGALSEVKVSVRAPDSLYWGGAAFDQTTETFFTATGTTSWSYPLAFASLSLEGSYTITVKSIASGVESATTSTTFTKDGTGPVTTFALTGPVSGAVSLAATAADAAGVASVRFQYREAGSTNWVEIGADSAAPYEAAWDTRSLPKPKYDVRAVATDGVGNEGASATSTVIVRAQVKSVILIDDSKDDAGILGRDDKVVITFSQPLKLSTICAGLVDSPHRVDGNNVVTVKPVGTALTVAATTCTVTIGTIDLGVSYGTATYKGAGANASTITWDPVAFTLTIRVGVGVGEPNAAAPAATVTYTPSSAVQNTESTAVDTTPFTATNQRF